MANSIPLDSKILVHEAGLFSKLKNTGQFTDEEVYKIIAELQMDDVEFTRLLLAVQDLLSELMITPSALQCMADGNSPFNYHGELQMPDESIRRITSDDCRNKVQLSGYTARKLISAGVLNGR